MSNQYFKQFITKKDEKVELKKDVLAYTRVSSKNQEDNYSLENQEANILRFAKDNDFNIIDTFGGTYESAKSDLTRKEFQELLNYIGKMKKKPYAILVNVIDRFSRTGGNAIGLVDNLILEKKVHLIEATTGISTENERQRLQIYNKLIKAREENLDRIDRTKPGLISHLKNGKNLGHAPRGYDHYGPKVRDYAKIEGKQRIVINAKGLLLKKAWKWKLEGDLDFEIIKKLKKEGLSVSKQFISAMWKRPFYCGISTNSMLDDAVNGTWEPLISVQDFMKVQELLKRKSGYQIEKTNNARPLMRHLKCAECGAPLTGYEVKKKKLHYYTCQKCKGVTLNANNTMKSKSNGAHEMYADLLRNYELPDNLTVPFKEQIKKVYDSLNNVNHNSDKLLNNRLEKLRNKLISLTDKYINDDFEGDIYKSMKSNIEKEINEINAELGVTQNKISNLDLLIEKTILISKNISKSWVCGDYETKIQMQNLVFPSGIVYDSKKRQYLTKNSNAIFSEIRDVVRVSRGQKKDDSSNFLESSSVVAGARLELTTFGL